MQQMDLFNSNSEEYFYQEIEKLRNSMDRRSRAMFALITEIQDQILLIKKEDSSDENAV